ncbi:MAG: hypothetical protein RJA26_829, partial [Actinomycetota bacterium]
MQQAGFVSLRNVTQIQRTEVGFDAALDHEILRVEVIKPDLLRMRISRGRSFDDSPSYALAIEPLAEAKRLGHDQSFELSVSDALVSLSTSAVQLEVYTQEFGFSLSRTDGSVV